jgi:hypothetical protein
MAGTITLPTVTIVAGWVAKDLMFVLNSPAVTGPLASYFWHLIVEHNGTDMYEDPLDPPDAHGRIRAAGKDLNPHGGVLILSGLYQGQFNLQDGSVNPLISGRCPYTTRIHGNLLVFKVNPVIGQAGSTAVAGGDATARSDATLGTTGTLSYAPGGIGGSVAGTVTQPGDVRTRTDTQTTTRNITSVTGLLVEQVAAPR